MLISSPSPSSSKSVSHRFGSVPCVLISVSSSNPSFVGAPGDYSFTMTVTASYGTSHSDDISVTVNAEPNVAPVASAGDDQSHTVAHDGAPADQGVDVSVCASGSTDSEGDALSYEWSSGETTECISANLTTGSYS